jgi:hypothetical protein
MLLHTWKGRNYLVPTFQGMIATTSTVFVLIVALAPFTVNVFFSPSRAPRTAFAKGVSGEMIVISCPCTVSSFVMTIVIGVWFNSIFMVAPDVALYNVPPFGCCF